MSEKFSAHTSLCSAEILIVTRASGQYRPALFSGFGWLVKESLKSMCSMSEWVNDQASPAHAAAARILCAEQSSAVSNNFLLGSRSAQSFSAEPFQLAFA